ncbi:MAG: ATP-binding cassette domain-containing protein [Gemmatimonadota bacterium]
MKSASLWAEAGKVTTLMGRNGSGKTTLMRVAAGTLRPDFGVVSFFGQVTEHPRLARLARQGLMFVPQNRLAMPHYLALDQLQAVASRFGRTHVDQAIEVARLAPLLDRPVDTMSGGERARLSLGLAFVRQPRVLIADEPLVGLAPVEQEALAELLRTLAANGTAVVTSGHDARILLNASDVIIWSAAGTTHHLGSPSDALGHEQFRREYLGPAFT